MVEKVYFTELNPLYLHSLSLDVQPIVCFGLDHYLYQLSWFCGPSFWGPLSTEIVCDLSMASIRRCFVQNV